MLSEHSQESIKENSTNRKEVLVKPVPWALSSNNLSDADLLLLIRKRYEPESVQHLYAAILVEELVRLGVNPFIISPGMRAVPLIMAFDSPVLKQANSFSDQNYLSSSTRKILVNDERSAGYFAVGAAKSGALPCLICTSGTAVANYLPSVIEAWYSRVPLLIISTDRPWELRSAGANQTINQKDIFRDCTVKSIDMPAPDNRIHVHSLLTTLDYVVSEARSELRPVHLNLGFRKPFYQNNFNPDSSFEIEDLSVLGKWIGNTRPYVNINSSRSISSPDISVQCLNRSDRVRKNKKKIVIIAGPSHSPHWSRRSLTSDFYASVIDHASKLNVPVISDIHSNIRQHKSPQVCALHQLYIKELVAEDLVPDEVLYVGERIVSTHCQEYLELVAMKKDSRIIKFQTFSERDDAIENEFIHYTHVTPYLDEAIKMLPDISEIDESFTRAFLSKEAEFRTKLGNILETERSSNTTCSERSYITTLISGVPSGTKVMLSASAVFREADNFCYDIPPGVILYGNRGATGIDGIISTGTGLGCFEDNKSPVLIILGDQAALHDLTGLSLLKNVTVPVIVAIINNQGGALFNIVNKSSILPSLVNSHDLTFDKFAEGFGVSYHKAENPYSALGKMLDAFDKKEHLLLELPVDGRESALKLNQI
ncbi:MAG TPA: 2-succinyl-5-enolpyruvyl-6-hydroxy-3-cyclohexene-1-carboxylic-acid synthase [Oligoflexia bacterium]|nr:2-succinyl-5-enolpyruvyl-6-hydroxy-3-cyclohexene-1-carboxylic-acid synthase [Oligoflexia bacterium]HMP47751.1 2-succinyl-5-enolpyruvyl-6-hydroxy-3-cyclohexene-1-carboxylic-acid synthase [Oligoflexia bacterium]